MPPLPDFDTPKLADAVEALSLADIDRLPFGVIGLDPQGAVRVYSATEARLSGYGNRPVIGRTFFTEIAPCMDNGHFRGLIEKARKQGTLDIRFTFIGDFSDRSRELTVRVQAAKDGGTWIFHHRAGML